VKSRIDSILLARIKELHDEAHEAMKLPITKEELLKVAKAELREGRERAIGKYIMDQLKGAQAGYITPFSQTGCNHTFSDDLNVWQLFFLAVSEKDIEFAVESLEETGVPANEREARIKAINEEVQRLSEILDSENPDLIEAEAGPWGWPMLAPRQRPGSGRDFRADI
jgi:hypothetical protein